MLPRAIFFDMDDTLLNTSGGVDASWGAVCAEFSPALGCDPASLRATIKAEMQRFWSDEAAVEREWRTRLEEARTHVVGLALTREGLDAGRAPHLSRRYWEENSSRMRLFDDAIETLTSLREAGFRVGLITNGPASMQRWKIGQFALESYFDVLVIEGEFGHGKPSPKVFEHALGAVGVDPHQAWHVG
ncbi:MAG: HAD family hydrolase, partial [Anaerolineaceae bacterium]